MAHTKTPWSEKTPGDSIRLLNRNAKRKESRAARAINFTAKNITLIRELHPYLTSQLRRHLQAHDISFIPAQIQLTILSTHTRIYPEIISTNVRVYTKTLSLYRYSPKHHLNALHHSPVIPPNFDRQTHVESKSTATPIEKITKNCRHDRTRHTTVGSLILKAWHPRIVNGPRVS